MSATHVQGYVQSLSRFDMATESPGHSGLHTDAEADEATIVDVDGPARIIDPQDDVRLARYHRYGCLFDDAACACKTGCLYMSGTGSWYRSITSEMCAVMYYSEHLGDFCNSDWMCGWLI